jgi:hypothetical protein
VLHCVGSDGHKGVVWTTVTPVGSRTAQGLACVQNRGTRSRTDGVKHSSVLDERERGLYAIVSPPFGVSVLRTGRR